MGGAIGSKDDGAGVLFAAPGPGKSNTKQTKDRTNIQVILPNQKPNDNKMTVSDIIVHYNLDFEEKSKKLKSFVHLVFLFYVSQMKIVPVFFRATTSTVIFPLPVPL